MTKSYTVFTTYLQSISIKTSYEWTNDNFIYVLSLNSRAQVLS